MPKKNQDQSQNPALKQQPQAIPESEFAGVDVIRETDLALEPDLRLEPEPEQPMEPEPSPPQMETEQVTLATLPHAAIKAESWGIHDRGEPMFQARCHNCNAPMWTWSEREDTCERCGYELRVERGKQFDKGQSTRNANPFEEQPYRGPVGLQTSESRRAPDPFSPSTESRRSVNPFAGSGGRTKIPNPF